MIITGIGISGNLGKPFCSQALERGHTVRCVALHADRAELPAGIELYNGGSKDSDVLTKVFSGSDVIVPVFPPSVKDPWSYADEHRNIISCAKAAGAERIVALLGSSGAKVSLGCKLVETDYFAETTRHFYMNIVDTWEVYRNEKEIEWAAIIPAARMQTQLTDRGAYRLRTDEYLVVDDEKSLMYYDVSQISYGDCARAMLDEIESRTHSGCFISVGY